MRHLSIVLAIALVVTACREAGPSSAPSAPSAAPLSTLQARALTPEALTARTLAQLSDVLIPAPADGRPVMTRLNFRTRPRDTVVKGLCQSDRVVIPLQAARPVDYPRAHTPMRAAGVRTTLSFHLLGDKAERCDQIDPFSAPFVVSDTLGHASMGARVIQTIAAKAAAPDSRLAVDCDGMPDCRVWLATLSFNAVSRIKTCSGGEDALRPCLLFDIPGKGTLYIPYNIGRDGFSAGPVTLMQVIGIDEEDIRQD